MSEYSIPLQRGLEFYYEAQKEFERLGKPIDIQVALGYEAGYHAGKAEANIPHSNYKMREWA